MTDMEVPRWVYGGASDTSAEDSRPEVGACFFCESTELAVSFDYDEVEGQRVAVPSWVGLCADCVADVQSQSFESIVARSRGTRWDDVGAQDFIQVATAMTGAVRPYRRRPN